MKNNDDIPTTDTTEIKQLINRLRQSELDQGDALLIEKLLNFLLTIGFWCNFPIEGRLSLFQLLPTRQALLPIPAGSWPLDR
jgi:hypothetical protein